MADEAVDRKGKNAHIEQHDRKSPERTRNLREHDAAFAFINEQKGQRITDACPQCESSRFGKAVDRAERNEHCAEHRAVKRGSLDKIPDMVVQDRQKPPGDKIKQRINHADAAERDQVTPRQAVTKKPR